MLLLAVGLLSVTALGAYLKGRSDGKSLANAENVRLEQVAQNQAQKKAVEAIKETERKNEDVIQYIVKKPRDNRPILPNWSDTRKRLHETYKGNHSQ